MGETRVAVGYGPRGELIEYVDGPVRCADCRHLLGVEDDSGRVLCRICECGQDGCCYHAVPEGAEMDECCDFEAA